MLFRTEPLPIIDYPAKKTHYGTNRIAYDFIILHDTGGTDSVKWLAGTSNNPIASAHRLINRAGAIIKIVPDHYVAYTQGFGSMGGYPDNERNTDDLNRVSLSIEFERLKSQSHTIEQLRSGAKQVVEWYGAHDMPSLLYHWQIDNRKDDPYTFDRRLFMDFVLNELAKYI
jgi:N-acetyl-anhydromuramyl-L-alanine amidase AmpD